jgi:hypothetical protein
MVQEAEERDQVFGSRAMIVVPDLDRIALPA